MVYRFSLSSSYVMRLWGLSLHKEHLLEHIPHLRHAEVGCAGNAKSSVSGSELRAGPGTGQILTSDCFTSVSPSHDKLVLGPPNDC